MMQNQHLPPSNAASFTTHYQQVLAFASEEASALGHSAISTEHLLLALLHQHTSRTAQVLAAYGVTLDEARQAVATLSGKAAAEPQVLAFHPDAQRALQLAMNEAHQRNHPIVGTEHLLLGLLHDDANGAVRVLQHLHVSLERVRAEVTQILNRQDAEDAKN
jgi:ATP-dependent Clp protease ATP-binding subunit ClpC